LVFEGFEIRPGQRQVLRAGAAVRLGARAFDVLLALVSRPDRVVAKAELMAAAWPGMVVEEGNLAVQVASLRRLLGPETIATVPGRGYQWAGGPPRPPASSPADAPAAVTQLPASAPAIAAGPALPGDELVGRSAELARLRQALSGAGLMRVVSLVGPAGIGKTTLARALVAPMAAAGCVAELAALPAQPGGEAGAKATAAVASAVAQALGAPPATSMGPLQALLRELTWRADQHTLPALLVLDNCEHVRSAARALCGAMKQVAPQLPLLVTSQVPLDLPDEHVLRLEALALPDGDSPERVAASPAVQLFCTRTQAADRYFSLTAANAAPVAEICRRLDGIPLALELAAGRVPLLGIEGLRARLSERFGLLRQPAGTAPPRHQTLWAALDWSHDLLPPAERALLRRLSVFSGSFTAHAAQQLSSGRDLDTWAVLDALSALVDKSLVSRHRAAAVADASRLDEPRFVLLETVRAYAQERLQHSGEAEAFAGRHAELFLALAEAHGGGMLGGDKAPARRRHVVPELDNVRAALAWLLAHDLPRALRVGAALVRVWREQGLLAEARTALRTLLHSTAGQPPDPTRLLVQVGLGAMALEQDDTRLLQEMGEQVLHASRALGDQQREAFGHGMLAHAAFLGNDTDGARRHFGQVLRLNALLGNELGQAETKNNLAHCWLADGQLGEALAMASQALQPARDCGSRWTEAAVLQTLGDVSLASGHLEQAHAQLTESLLLRRGVGHVYQIVASLLSLTMVQLRSGQLDAARAHLLEATQGCIRHGYGHLDALCLVCAGSLAAQSGQAEAAAQLGAAGQARLNGTPQGRQPHIAQTVDAAGQRARRQLGAAAWQRERDRGAALGHAQALAMALAAIVDAGEPQPAVAGRI
jgi:predicted ATPase/DNA-binding winged helix-turn-helix (wHTH) protein